MLYKFYKDIIYKLKDNIKIKMKILKLNLKTKKLKNT